MNIKVTASSAIGKRKYMEDRIQVKFGTDPVPYLFLAIFDGHGGPQAAEFAKEHLLAAITAQKTFWSSDVSEIETSLKDAFISTHNKICENIGKITRGLGDAHSSHFWGPKIWKKRGPI